MQSCVTVENLESPPADREGSAACVARVAPSPKRNQSKVLKQQQRTLATNTTSRPLSRRGEEQKSQQVHYLAQSAHSLPSPP